MFQNLNIAKNILFGFYMNIMKIFNLKTYLTAPSKCFIPKCKAHCCADAPLPIDFLPKHDQQIQRSIYGITNIGRNDPRDKYDSVLFNTTGNPIQILGVDQDGHKVLGIPKDKLKKMQIKSQEQIQALLEDYQAYPNYCPFLKNNGRCNVYTERPPICKEFGTDPDPINFCPDRVSRLGIMDFVGKSIIDFYKEQFQNIGRAIVRKFSKSN